MRPAQLMQLRQTEAFGVLYDHDVGISHIDAHLDDRGRDQHVDLAPLEAGHGRVFVVGAHAAVQQANVQAGELVRAQAVVHLDGGLQFALLGPRRARCCACIAPSSMTG